MERPAPEPAYVTVRGGQVRLFRTGAGPDLVVLGGLALGAAATAASIAEACRGWRVTVLEPPGIGGSADCEFGSPDDIADRLAEAIRLCGFGRMALVALDLAGTFAIPVAGRLARWPDAVCTIGMARARAWLASGRVPPPPGPTTDGTHLPALWTFLRDLHVFEAGDPTQPARDGDPIPSPTVLDATIVAAATRPGGYTALWSACADGMGRDTAEPRPRPFDDLDALARHLGGLDVPAGTAPLPRPSPGPPGGIWHDEIATARGRLHVRRAGHGAGQAPLVVLPTGGGSSAQFAPVVTGLARDRDVVAVDYRGNGLSSRPDGPVTIESLARDTLALLDALDIATADIWGSHTGALVGLELAVLAPDRVGRVVLEGPVFLSAEAQADILARYFPPLEPDPWGRHLQAAWHWRRDMFLFWPWYRVARDAARRLGLPTPRHLHDYTIGILESGPSYDGAYRAAFSYDTRARLPRLRRPALVCAGPNDMLIGGLDEVRRLSVPGVTVEVTPTTVWWPDPDPAAAAATLDLYDAFLRG